MQASSASTEKTTEYRVGQWVEVRTAEEIMATLDDKGDVDALPFMPEMLQYCGRRLRVGKVANKVCDTMTRSGMRRMENAVHLMGVRCDGSSHSGCQAACLIYWKTDWIKPADGPGDSAEPIEADHKVFVQLTERAQVIAPDGSDVYRCQATEILRAAPEVLPLLDFGQYAQDIRTGNAGIRAVSRAFLVGFFNRYQQFSARKLPKWLRIRGGLTWGFLRGSEGPTPTGRTDLQPGELVRVKSKEEIMKTLNTDLLNRGLGFDAEMARFCGQTARVLRRIDTIVDENTGKMLRMKSPCIVLEGVVCEGAFSANCPRAITAYWREIWLERVEPAEPVRGLEREAATA
ncbi:MAG: hypothetical protein HOU81_04965 [Hamadaea sp.]|uniref:hypothetical protein n=1 Tax=Hamadaea sp. TaxID=2024425 RepID=UPI0017FFCCE9|nr:hypothetical protein [Hamadaea sp.]NUR70147.1 hypothetical protein [Hamadaea sp.]NUT23539.1 hypothetical protein [Hamadaea sp.]